MKVEIEIAETGWIIREKGKAPRFFSLWHQLEAYLKSVLTSSRAQEARYDK